MEGNYLLKNRERNNAIFSSINNNKIYEISVVTLDSGEIFKIEASGEVLKGYLEALKEGKGVIVEDVILETSKRKRKRSVIVLPVNKITFFQWYEEGV
jgi:hypothetical protein